MSQRKTKLVDCNPRWIERDGVTCGVRFDCPEGHTECHHAIPFTPSLEGGAVPTWQSNGAQWQRTGEDFAALTLSPSIRRNPQYASRDAAMAAGCIPEYVTDSTLCALHIFIANGEIQFCGDSR